MSCLRLSPFGMWRLEVRSSRATRCGGSPMMCSRHPMDRAKKRGHATSGSPASVPRCSAQGNRNSVADDGTVTVLGDVGNDNSYVTLDYDFDLLGIASNNNLFFWNPTTSTLTQNTDPDLGPVLDTVWVDGYWMTTDGEFLVVTELGNPLAVNPLKYGSSEIDPDPVVALLKLRNEIYALNRYTIEVFDNVGGDLFPFQRIDGAQIEKGVIGTHACCNFMETITFLGSGFNESPGVYMGGNANASKISTQEIDEILMNM